MSGPFSKAAPPALRILRVVPTPRDIAPKAWLRRRQRRNFLLSCVFPVLVFTLWELLSRTEVLEPHFFPPPTTILANAWKLTTNGVLATHLLATFLRILWLTTVAPTLRQFAIGRRLLQWQADVRRRLCAGARGRRPSA